MIMSRGWNILRSVRDPFLVSVAFSKRHVMMEHRRDGKVSLSLVPLVTKEEHLSWAEKIKPHRPHCVTMYNNLLQHGRGHVSHDTFYVLQGRPSSHAIVCDKKISPTTQHTGVFCLEEDVDPLINALRFSSIVKWRGDNVVINHIPPYLLPPLQRLAEQNGAKVEVTACLAFTYDPHFHTQPLRISKGFRVCRLGRRGVRLLYERAKYGEGMPLDLMYSLAQRVPYLGVYQDAAMMHHSTVDVINLPEAGDEEVPVAWVCSTPSGEIGKLMADEGFRRCGLGGLLTTVMARQQAALMGFIPHAFLDPDNTASIELFSKNPGWSYTHDAFWMSSIKKETETQGKTDTDTGQHV